MIARVFSSAISHSPRHMMIGIQNRSGIGHLLKSFRVLFLWEVNARQANAVADQIRRMGHHTAELL